MGWEAEMSGWSCRNALVCSGVLGALGLLLLPSLLVSTANGGQLDFDREARRCNDAAQPEASIQACTALINSGRLSQASAPFAFYRRAIAHERNGDLDQAIRDYSEAIRLRPNYHQAFNNRAVAYRRKGDLDQAIRDYSEAIRLDQDSPGPFYNRGLAYAAKGDHTRAIGDYSEAIRLYPDYAQAFSSRGLAYVRKGDLDQAIRDFDEAIRLDREYPEAWNNRGLVYAHRGDLDRAIQHFDQALRLRGRYPEALTNRGYSYADKGDYRQAIRDFDEAVRLYPSDHLAWKGRGHVRFYSGEFSAAVLDFAEASRLEPMDTYAAFWLQLARLRAGQAAARLKAEAQRLDSDAWPAPIVRLFVGAATPEQVIAAARHPDPKQEREQLCQAYFYAGQRALLQGDKAEAAGRFRAALGTGARNLVEYTAAKVDLQRVGC